MAKLVNIPVAQPFYGRGLWLDRPVGSLSFKERCELVRSFLRGHEIYVPDVYIEVFSFCHTAPELWFVYEVTRSSGWERQGERSLTNHLHKITIGARPTGIRIPILFEDLTRGHTIAVDIQPPRHFLPGVAERDRIRRTEIARCVDRMYGVPDYQARGIGKKFHVDLIRQRLALMGNSPPPPKPALGRFWTGGELSYDLSTVPVAERLPVLSDWLRSHNRYVPESLLPVLIHCNRAGELLFVLQLLSFQGLHPSEKAVTVGGAYQIKVQPEICGWIFDFLIEPVSPLASYSRTVIEVEPATHFTRDVRLELSMAEKLTNMGYQFERVTAANAKYAGRRWHERFVKDLVKEV
jgi:hypothetical protein